MRSMLVEFLTLDSHPDSNRNRAKRSGEKNRFFSRAIDTEASLPFDQAWSRASKKVGPSVSIDQEPEKCESEGAFYMILMLKMAHFPIQMRSLAFEDQ